MGDLVTFPSKGNIKHWGEHGFSVARQIGSEAANLYVANEVPPQFRDSVVDFINNRIREEGLEDDSA